MAGQLLCRGERYAVPGEIRDGAVTSDDIADDLADAWGDGGKWVGSCVLALARDGLIVEIGTARSARPSRHRGRVTLWGIGDRDAVDRRRRELRAMLAALDDLNKNTGEAAATASPAIEIPPTRTKEGTEFNG